MSRGPVLNSRTGKAALSEHGYSKTNGLGEMARVVDTEVSGGEAHDSSLGAARLTAGWAAPARKERMAPHTIKCNACPLLCHNSEGKVGACDHCAKQGGALLRVDPVLLLRRYLDGVTSVLDSGLASLLAQGDAGAVWW